MLREQAKAYFESFQDRLCARLANVDGGAEFREDLWDYAPGDGPGVGGGRTRVIEGGALFEKAGVNVSALEGRLSDRIADRLNAEQRNFFATGVSIVIHPENPHIPTTHANLRYLELTDDDGKPQRAWFGGGADLTPYYPDDEAAVQFHTALKSACDGYQADAYRRFKEECDRYFFLAHRGEARGVGGIFYDYLEQDLDQTFSFTKSVGEAFLNVYPEIVEGRRDKPWTAEQRDWQLHRRGRYVEFNLIYDRGTLFGLETKGRTESILMSLPPHVRWSYDYDAKAGSAEEKLMQVVREPRDWVES